jgi:putative aldouronate transport system permease protein
MFEQIFIMYNPAVMDVADVLSTFSYREAFQMGNVGYGTAIGLFVSTVTLILVIGVKWFSKRFLDEEIL